MTKYAFLYSGGIIDKHNYNRYANDLGFAYKVLTEKYHYIKENVTVMYADGRIIRYANLEINTCTAKRHLFLSKMSEYSNKILPDDLFIFVVSNHGGENGELFSWDEKAPIQMQDVLAALDVIPCAKIILMGQCFGGNYIGSDIEDSIVISANIPGAVSYGKITFSNGKYATDKDNEYDEFLYNFFSYCNGSYPFGEPLSCTKIDNSVISAYEYSKNSDYFRNGILLNGEQCKETPCLKINIADNYKNISLCGTE